MRTVIYARFSSRLQDDSSIEQQVSMCRERAEREGWEIVDVFADYAISGKAGLGEHQRPGMSAMLARVGAGGVDQVLAESTDRIARHQGDDFTVRELLDHGGVRLFTLMEGLVDEITGTFKGLMNARFRKDLGARIKRGQRGMVAQGRAPAGIAFGYRMANKIDARGLPVRGLREIDPEQALTVVRIFTEYAAGLSPHRIAERLNAENVPGPRGTGWTESTIRGDRKRQNGILANRLYNGELIVNRTSKLTDPRTRKTVIRANPESDWIIQPVPELRIVPAVLWDQVQAMREETRGAPMQYQRRPKHILSGLGRCGVCGGPWTRKDQHHWSCGRQRDGRCSNARKISTGRYEAEVIRAVQDQLLDPDLVAAYLREYHRESARRAGDVARERAALERRLNEATRKIARLVEVVATAGDIEEIVVALRTARQERDRCAAELAHLDAIPVIALHPGLADDYRRQVMELSEALNSPEAELEAVPKFRALIDSITLTPSQGERGVDVAVTSRLDAILRLATNQPIAIRAA